MAVNNINDVIFYLIVYTACVCNLVDHVILYCLQSSVGSVVTDIATEISHVVAQVVQPAVAVVSIRDASILVSLPDYWYEANTSLFDGID